MYRAQKNSSDKEFNVQDEIKTQRRDSALRRLRSKSSAQALKRPREKKRNRQRTRSFKNLTNAEQRDVPDRRFAASGVPNTGTNVSRSPSALSISISAKLSLWSGGQWSLYPATKLNLFQTEKKDKDQKQYKVSEFDVVCFYYWWHWNLDRKVSYKSIKWVILMRHKVSDFITPKQNKHKKQQNLVIKNLFWQRNDAYPSAWATVNETAPQNARDSGVTCFEISYACSRTQAKFLSRNSSIRSGTASSLNQSHFSFWKNSYMVSCVSAPSK